MTGFADRDVNRALKERLAQVQGDYERIRDGLADLQQQMAAVTGTATSTGGLIKATVDARGRLSGLTVAPRAMRDLDHEQLAASIVEIVGQATTQVTEEVAGLLERFSPMAGSAAAYVRTGGYDDLLRRTDETTGWRPPDQRSEA